MITLSFNLVLWSKPDSAVSDRILTAIRPSLQLPTRIYTPFMYGFVTVLLRDFPLKEIESTTPTFEIVNVTSLGDMIYLPPHQDHSSIHHVISNVLE